MVGYFCSGIGAAFEVPNGIAKYEECEGRRLFATYYFVNRIQIVLAFAGAILSEYAESLVVLASANFH
jgi:hypothetical protein